MKKLVLSKHKWTPLYISDSDDDDEIEATMKIGQSIIFDNIREYEKVNRENWTEQRSPWNIALKKRIRKKSVKFKIEFEIEKEEVQNQKPKSKFLAKELFLNEIYSDLKIHCQGRIFPCHKNILYVRSKYFEACLAHDGTKESQSGIIEIEDFSPEVIEKLLKYIYTNEINENEITMELFAALDKYDLAEDLREICVKRLKSNITIYNAEEILARSYQIGLSDLRMAAFKFITNSENLGKIVRNEIWHEACLKAIGSAYLDPNPIEIVDLSKV